MAYRILWLDITRIIAIFLVVFAHTIGTNNWTPVVTQSDKILNAFYASLLELNVPLFLMISGALLLHKQEPYTAFFTRRFSKILIPWILWAGLYVAWMMFINGFETASLARIYYVTLVSQFWFMPLIVGIYLLTPLLRLWLDKAKFQDIMYALVLWVTVYSLAPLILNVFISSYTIPYPFVLEHIGYFLLGYAVMQWKTNQIQKKVLIAIILSCITANALGILYSTREVMDYFWYNISVFVVIATTASFALLKSVFQTYSPPESTRRYQVLVMLSNASFGIFLSHMLIFAIVKTLIPAYPLPYAGFTLLPAILLYSVSVLVIVGIQKTPLKKILAP